MYKEALTKAAQLFELSGTPLYRLAKCYLKGRGVAQDHTKALGLLTRSADLGHPNGLNRLGELHDHDLDAKRAASCFARAADEGLAKAQFNIGVCFDQGDGVEQDHAKARRYSTLAAAQGYHKANMNLAFALLHGRGVAQDRQEAMRLRALTPRGEICTWREQGLTTPHPDQKQN